MLFQIADYSPVIFYYNPNITQTEEYYLRLRELERYAADLGLEVIEYPPDTEAWYREVEPCHHLGERSVRCYNCYAHRMEFTFRYAKEHGFDAVTTVLSVSPHKVYRWIAKIGNELAERYGVRFYDADFKKNNGFLVSVRTSKEYGFYRQSYCGCEWSRVESEQRHACKNEETLSAEGHEKLINPPAKRNDNPSVFS